MYPVLRRNDDFIGERLLCTVNEKRWRTCYGSLRLFYSSGTVGCLGKCRPYTTVRCIRFSGCLFGGELHSKDGYFWCPPRSLVHLIDAHHWQFCFRKTSVILEQRSVASDHIHLWLMIWSTNISSRSNPKMQLILLDINFTQCWKVDGWDRFGDKMVYIHDQHD